MLLVAPVRKERRIPLTAEQEKLFGIAKLNIPKSDIPAVTHVDYSARIETVAKSEHPVFYNLLNAFHKKTGCAVLVNTSFNVRGEPIVCTPKDAYTCFMRTEMDVLVINNFVMFKEEQPKWQDKEDWQTKFELD
jgi:carbamoyltransferase